MSQVQAGGTWPLPLGSLQPGWGEGHDLSDMNQSKLISEPQCTHLCKGNNNPYFSPRACQRRNKITDREYFKKCQLTSKAGRA